MEYGAFQGNVFKFSKRLFTDYEPTLTSKSSDKNR